MGITCHLEPDWAAIARRHRLQPREAQVLRGMWHDHKQSEVAAELKISLNTFKTYWKTAKLKLRVQSRVEAIHLVHAFMREQEAQPPPPPPPPPSPNDKLLPPGISP